MERLMNWKSQEPTLSIQAVIKYIFIAVFLALVPVNAFSHSGGTNSEGCHNQYSNNTYHCHNTGNNDGSAELSELNSLVEGFERERAHIANPNFQCIQAPNGQAPTITNYATGMPTTSFLMQFWKENKIVLREDNEVTYGRYTFGLNAEQKSTGFLGLSTIQGERGIFEHYNTSKFQMLESYDNQEYAMRWNNFKQGPSFLIAKDHSEQSITQTRGRGGWALFNCVRR